MSDDRAHRAKEAKRLNAKQRATEERNERFRQELRNADDRAAAEDRRRAEERNDTTP